MSLTNQACMARVALINLNLDEHYQGLRYYPFMASLDRCKGGCNTLDNLSNICCE